MLPTVSASLNIGTSDSRPSLCVFQCCSSRYSATVINVSCCSARRTTPCRCQHVILPNSIQCGRMQCLCMVQPVRAAVPSCWNFGGNQPGIPVALLRFKCSNSVTSLGSRPGCRDCHILLLVLEQCCCSTALTIPVQGVQTGAGAHPVGTGGTLRDSCTAPKAFTSRTVTAFRV